MLLNCINLNKYIKKSKDYIYLNFLERNIDLGILLIFNNSSSGFMNFFFLKFPVLLSIKEYGIKWIA